MDLGVIAMKKDSTFSKLQDQSLINRYTLVAYPGNTESSFPLDDWSSNTAFLHIQDKIKLDTSII